MKRIFAALAVLLLACGKSSDSPTASSSSSGAAYVSAMIDIMQANSVNRKTIDWTGFRSRVLAAVPSGANIVESNTAILLAVELLGDNHSSYTSTTGVVLRSTSLNCFATIINSVAQMPPDVGYVRVTEFTGPNGGPAAQVFTDAIQNAIRAADTTQLTGWIVDLRGNLGGNMWPMIAGIGPILGTGTTGFFVDPDFHSQPWGYDGTESLLNGIVQQTATSPYTLRTPSPYVAVLLDGGVASSGEAVAVAFKQRPNTRFFGTATCGLSTANSPFTLSDGAILNLTVSTDADRTSTMYGGPLQPDQLITDPSAVVTAAVAWLHATAQASK